jgi:hypothetical protein
MNKGLEIAVKGRGSAEERESVLNRRKFTLELEGLRVVELGAI